MKIKFILTIFTAVIWIITAIGCPVEFDDVELEPYHSITGLDQPRKMSIVEITGKDYLFVCDTKKGILKISLEDNDSIFTVNDKSTSFSSLEESTIFTFKTGGDIDLTPIDFDVASGRYMFVLLKNEDYTKTYIRRIDLQAEFTVVAADADIQLISFQGGYLSVNSDAIFVSGYGTNSIKAYIIDNGDSYNFVDATTDTLKIVRTPGRIFANANNWVYISDRSYIVPGVRMISFDPASGKFDTTTDFFSTPANTYFAGITFDSNKLYGVSGDGLVTYDLALDTTTDTEFNKMSKKNTESVYNLHVNSGTGYLTRGYSILIINNIDTATPTKGKTITLGSRYQSLDSFVWVNDCILYNNGTDDYLISSSQGNGTLIINLLD